MTPPGTSWRAALAAARAGERVANVVWLGDSLSELDADGWPIPWVVGRVLSGWVENTQYRNAGVENTPTMATTGTPTPMELSGFGGRSVDLAPGQGSSMLCAGEALSVLWTRQEGGGSLEVTWGGERIGTIDTAGPHATTQITTIRRQLMSIPELLEIVACDGPARLEGVYVHLENLDSGVRVWPAIRSGNTTRHYLDHTAWALDVLDRIPPDLVVLATGTNDGDAYTDDLGALIQAVRLRTDADIAVWIPYVSPLVSRRKAAAGRALAEARGCLVIDGASAIGVPTTVDDLHPSPLASALAGAHAGVVLSSDPLGTAAQMAGQAAVSFRDGQVWHPGGGRVAVESVLGSSVLGGRSAPRDEGDSWALLLPGLAKWLYGLPGPTLAFGPGGHEPVDAHLSRAAPARLSLNGGKGQLDLARLLVEESDPAEPASSGAVLHARRRDGVTELVAVLPDGEAHVVAPRPAAGVHAPLPCSLAPAHRRSHQGAALPAGRVHWVPFPALAAPATATHVWLDVEVLEVGTVVTAAVVLADRHGGPGRAVGCTAPIDLSEVGVRGAALTDPVDLAAGAAWWIALLAQPGGDQARVSGADALDGVPVVHVGPAPVAPGQQVPSGVLVADGLSEIPDGPVGALMSVPGPVPVPHVSLQPPEG